MGDGCGKRVNELSCTCPANRHYERTVLTILDQVFRECDHDEETRRIEPSAYHLAFRNCAGKYQVWGMKKDARRCVRQALWAKPSAIDATLIRLLVKAYLPEWLAKITVAARQAPVA